MGSPIHGFVGPNGSGKTLAAIELVVKPAVARGIRVMASFPIDLPGCSIISDWRALTEVSDCVLLLDEVTTSFPSRGFGASPQQLVRVMQQLRKRDVECVWTAPAWTRADVVLREVTTEVTVCEGRWGDRWQRERAVAPVPRFNPPRLRDESGRPLRISRRWPPNRLFIWRSYDSSRNDEFTLSSVRAEHVRPRGKVVYWRPFHDAQFFYDTYAEVELFDSIDEVGVCMECGGTRSRPRCTCGPRERPIAKRGRHAAGVGVS